MATILIKNLSKIYPPTIAYPRQVQALGGVNLSVTGNVFVAVLGPSGSGKTTLLNIVAGVDDPSAGSVQTMQDGVPAQVGYVFQEPRLLPWRSVIDNMLYVLDRKSERSRREAEAYLTMVGLREVAQLYPSQLSTGMQQRVGIARAFLVNPDILLMDEPFSHMDALTGRSLREYLQRIWLHTRKTALFVTHDVSEAVELADRVVLLRPGGVVFDDIPINLQRPRRPDDPAVRHVEVELLRRFDSMEAAVRFGNKQQ